MNKIVIAAHMLSPPHILEGSRWAGKRVGLLGGSFNPPHLGHEHISIIALNILKLDAIWWLVTPQNPLKSSSDLKPYEERMQACKDLVSHPRILITDIERQLGVNRSYDTLKALKNIYSSTNFVFVTGMDNALTFHHWYNWKKILGLTATAHIARPPAPGLIQNCPLRMKDSQTHHYLTKADSVPLISHNTFWILQNKMLGISSTEIRNNNNIS